MPSLLRPAARLAAVSPRTKVAIMIGGDAVFLPLCMMLAVAFRLGSLEAAVQMQLRDVDSRLNARIVNLDGAARLRNRRG